MMRITVLRYHWYFYLFRVAEIRTEVVVAWPTVGRNVTPCATIVIEMSRNYCHSNVTQPSLFVIDHIFYTENDSAFLSKQNKLSFLFDLFIYL